MLGATLVVPFSAAQDKPAAAPATVAGKWHFVFFTDGGDRVFEPVFQQDGDKVTGKWAVDGDVKGTFTEGKLNLSFPMNSEEAGPGTLTIKGTLADEGLAGDWAFNDYTGSFKATRIKD